jgi:repressor LexA
MPVSTSLLANPAAREAMMLEPLTDLERGILEYLIEYLRQHTYQPSIREIGRRFNIKSTKTVSEHLQALAEKGWIERDPARSRGIRVLGLELDVDTVAVPLHDAANPGPDLPAPDAFVAPCRQLLLDRSLVGTTRAAFLPMPDDALSDAGIHRGDLLLVEPVAAEDLEPGDIVVTNLAGQTAVLPWAELQGEPALTPAPLGRVNAIFRRLRIPPALVAAHGDADIDAGTHAN